LRASGVVPSGGPVSLLFRRGRPALPVSIPLVFSCITLQAGCLSCFRAQVLRSWVSGHPLPQDVSSSG